MFEPQPATPNSRSMKRIWPTVVGSCSQPANKCLRWLEPPIYGVRKVAVQPFSVLPSCEPNRMHQAFALRVSTSAANNSAPRPSARLSFSAWAMEMGSLCMRSERTKATLPDHGFGAPGR